MSTRLISKKNINNSVLPPLDFISEDYGPGCKPLFEVPIKTFSDYRSV